MMKKQESEKKKTCSHWKIKFSLQVFCSFTSAFLFFLFVTSVRQALNSLSNGRLALIWWLKRSYVNYLSVCFEPNDELAFNVSRESICAHRRFIQIINFNAIKQRQFRNFFNFPYLITSSSVSSISSCVAFVVAFVISTNATPWIYEPP